MRKMSCLLRVVDAISDTVGKVISFLVVFLFTIIVYEVVLRGIFNQPTNWVHVMSLYLLGAYLMLGGAYALRHEAHVKMDVFYARLSLRTKAILDLITSVFFFFFCVMLLWKGWIMAYESVLIQERSWGSGWEGPLYIVKMTVPLAAFLMLLQGLAKFIRDLIIVIKKVKVA